MTEIWPDYVAQAFLPPPGLNRQFQDVGSDRVNGENFKSRFYKYSKRQHKHNHINANRLAQEDDDDDMTDSL